jgi:hypothetical protein
MAQLMIKSVKKTSDGICHRALENMVYIVFRIKNEEIRNTLRLLQKEYVKSTLH